MIKAEKLTKRFAGRTAVRDVSFSVEPGETVGVLGPNGAGKTTTLRILTSYLPPTSGRVTVNGHDVFKESLKVRREIGYMPENVPLYNDMRVREYLRFRGALKGLAGGALRKNMDEVMDTCGIRDVRRAMIGTLSKGYRQRVGLADALVNKPKLLVLDEPTNGLDPNQIRQVREVIRDLGQRHTILISTHILTEVEMTCSRVIIINEGQVRASGSPEELVKRLRTAGTVKLEIQGPAEKISKALRGIGGVKKTELSQSLDSDWHEFELRTQADSDVREHIAALAGREKWPLRELTRHTASLEDAFVEMTTG